MLLIYYQSYNFFSNVDHIKVIEMEEKWDDIVEPLFAAETTRVVCGYREYNNALRIQINSIFRTLQPLQLEKLDKLRKYFILVPCH